MSSNKAKQLKEVLMFAAMLLIIARFIFSYRGDMEKAGMIVWIILPLILLVVLIQLSLRFFPGIYDKKQEESLTKKD
jgi:hypothetical protein